VRIDYDDVGCPPSTSDKILYDRRYRARLACTGRADDRSVAHDKTRGVQANRDFLRRRQTTQPQVLIVRMRKNGLQLIRRCEVHGVIKARIGTDATLKTPCPAINLAEQLNLQPTIVMLDHLDRLKWSSEFGDADETDARDEVD
jgi:hypothetical protein